MRGPRQRSFLQATRRDQSHDPPHHGGVLTPPRRKPQSNDTAVPRARRTRLSYHRIPAVPSELELSVSGGKSSCLPAATVFFLYGNANFGTFAYDDLLRSAMGIRSTEVSRFAQVRWFARQVQAYTRPCGMQPARPEPSSPDSLFTLRAPQGDAQAARPVWVERFPRPRALEDLSEDRRRCRRSFANR